MPNHVTNKIIFPASVASDVFKECCPDGSFDFNTLIPQPPEVYMGDLSTEDGEDFPCNWHSWNTYNWGTKWNAYGSWTEVSGETAFVQFDTAWSVPYPILAAFANRFKVPFEHRYFDEGSNFWGIETWEKVGNVVSRAVTRKSNTADYKSLCIELKGYDPDEESDD